MKIALALIAQDAPCVSVIDNLPQIPVETAIVLSSNAFQERVFSTGAFVMSSLRNCTYNHRAEMQVLMKHNRSEIRNIEMASFTDNKNMVQTESVWLVVSQ
ncbi:hypothetical protein PC123_g23491 [Phytophthora cactorum]|nr:hypothetical protein PC120_g23338 [Phytophthora cactorum]KAG4040979.1 hypothetical protein PC123_g23491 [Phytophthora cactorum]